MTETRSVFYVEAVYVEGAAEKRIPYRSEHLARLEKLMKEGALLLAAGLEDMTRSVLVFDVGHEDSAAAIVVSDVYWKKGIWTDYKIARANILRV